MMGVTKIARDKKGFLDEKRSSFHRNHLQKGFAKKQVSFRSFFQQKLLFHSQHQRKKEMRMRLDVDLQQKLFEGTTIDCKVGFTVFTSK